jgi:hypothetical protein
VDDIVSGECLYKPPALTVKVRRSDHSPSLLMITSLFASDIPTPFPEQSLVIISLVVALFTAPINSFVDLLFTEILCAPLAIQGKAKNNNTPTTTDELTKQATGERERRQALTRSTLFVDTVLVLPNKVTEAHTRVSLSAREIVDAAKATVESQMEKSLTIRMRNTTIRKFHPTRNINQQPRQPSSEEIRPSSALDGSTGKVEARRGGKGDVIAQTAHLSIDELFLDLTVDVNEQRKVLKRAQQDSYDALWGCVTLMTTPLCELSAAPR